MFLDQGKASDGTDVIVVTDQASNVQSMFWVVRETLRQQYDPLRNRRFLSLMYGTSGSSGISTGQYQIEINGTLYPERPVIWNRYYTMEVYLHTADAFKSLKAVPNQMLNVFNDRHAKDRTFSLTSVENNYRSGLIDSTVMGMRFDAFTTMESNTILSGPDTKSAAGRITLTVTHEAMTSFLSKNSADNDVYDQAITTSTNVTWDIYVVTKKRVLFSPTSGATVIM